MKKHLKNTRRRVGRLAALCAVLLLLATACGATGPAEGSTGAPGSSVQSTSGAAASPGSNAADAAHTWTDALGYPVTVERWGRVVSLYGSFAETWLLAGGELVGTTEDALTERGLVLGDEVAVVGTVKQPDLEAIFAAEPDFVLLSAEIEGQVKLHAALEQAGIPHAYFSVDAFADYLEMLDRFCRMTGRADLYEQNGLAVQRQIEQVKQTAARAQSRPTVLLLRAYSTGCKAKSSDNLAGVILEELGAQNLVEQHESLLEDVSIEEIIAADPDYIFVSIMGSSEENALDWLRQNLAANPTWAGLTAIQNERFYLLPKALFHYKPNARWGESYQHLAELLYPELFA